MTIPVLPTLIGLLGLFWLILPLTACAQTPRVNSKQYPVFVGVGGLILIAVASFAWLGASTAAHAIPGLALGGVPFSLRLDPLAAWALAIIGIVSAAVSPYIRGYMDHLSPRVDMRVFWVSLSLLLTSMAAVVTAANVQTFLIAWETMSLASFLLVITDRGSSKVREAGLIYLGATRVGTAFLATGFLWAHSLTGSWTFADWHLSGTAALGPGLLILVGLGLKAGMWPFHLWLPIAHPAAPAPVSALMSGVMVKMAVAVIIRLFVVDPSFSNVAFGVVLLALGSVGAVWGILFALIQQDLKRLLALSTVENIGLILASLGVCILASHGGSALGWAAQIALAAALLHMLNHAIFKSLLFLGAGSVDSATHTLDLGHLGGLAAKMPQTYATFLIGAGCACALPPLSGFSSEWLMYKAALIVSSTQIEPLWRFTAMLIVIMISLAGALAVTAFVKAIGVGFQGLSRSASADHAHEVGRGMTTSQTILAALCVLLGLSAPALLVTIQLIVHQMTPASPPIISAWTVSLPAAFVVMAFTFAAVAVWLKSARRRDPIKPYSTWDCGFGPVGPRAQVAGVSYVQPVARMFGVIFRYGQTLDLEGVDKRLFPEEITASVNYESLLEDRIYAPLIRWIWRIGDHVVALQEGSIHRYLLTMLLALAILVAVGGYSR